jgi:hypothetical protein
MIFVPTDTGVTTPPLVIVAVALLMLHTPPDTASLNVTAEPRQIVPGPNIVPEPGNGITVTTWDATAEPQLAVTV